MWNSAVPNIVPSLCRCVGGSDQLQLFAKEQERNKLLCSSAPQTSKTAPSTTMTPSALKSTAKEKTKSAAKKKQNFISGDGTKNGKEAGSIDSNKNVIEANEDLDEKGEILGQRLKTKRNTVEMKKTQQTQPEIPIKHQTQCKFFMQIFLFCR